MNPNHISKAKKTTCFKSKLKRVMFGEKRICGNVHEAKEAESGFCLSPRRIREYVISLVAF